MRKLLLIIALMASQTALAESLTLQNNINSENAIYYKLNQNLKFGPIMPGAKYVLSASEYEEIKGTFIRPIIITEDGSKSYKCPVVGVSKNIIYEGGFTKSYSMCGYSKGGLKVAYRS